MGWESVHEPYNHEVKMSREIVIEIGDKKGVDSLPGVALVIIGRWGVIETVKHHRAAGMTFLAPKLPGAVEFSAEG